MNYEKIEGRPKGSNIFCCDGYMYSKNNVYKNNLRCVLYKKTVPVLPKLNAGSFSIIKSTITHKVLRRSKKQKLKQEQKNESETSTLAPRDIYNKNINPENVDMGTFTKISSIMRKRRANNFPPIPLKVEDFDNLLKNGDFGTIDENIFYRTIASANDEFGQIFLAEIDLSFLNRIHSIHVDATFKTVPLDFYQLMIIRCLVLDTIIPVSSCLVRHVFYLMLCFS